MWQWVPRIFYVDKFIASLRYEVRILKQIPPRLKRRVELGLSYLPPISWSDITYILWKTGLYSVNMIYIFHLFAFCFSWVTSTNSHSCLSQILPLLLKHKVMHLNRTDARLAKNGLPLEIQKLRCKENFEALRFTPQIEELGRKIVRILRERGPFLVLHPRYEMDMLAFSGCTHGCDRREVDELTRMRYYFAWVFIIFWLFLVNFNMKLFTYTIYS